MVYHLSELRQGRAIDCPVYDFTVYNRSNEVQRIEPRQVIIVEGILIFADESLRDLTQMSGFAAGSSGMSTSAAGLWNLF